MHRGSRGPIYQNRLLKGRIERKSFQRWLIWLTYTVNNEGHAHASPSFQWNFGGRSINYQGKFHIRLPKWKLRKNFVTEIQIIEWIFILDHRYKKFWKKKFRNHFGFNFGGRTVHPKYYQTDPLFHSPSQSPRPKRLLYTFLLAGFGGFSYLCTNLGIYFIVGHTWRG